MSCEKIAEAIDIPLGCGLSWAQELCTRWGPDPYTWRDNLMAKRGRAGHARTCPMFNILCVTQHGGRTSMVQMPVGVY